MVDTDRPRFRGDLIVCGVFAVCAVGWFAAQHAGSLYDDAYIYFRYVDSLARGCGLRFNCADPPVEGFSSPLYLALLWVLHALGGALDELALTIGTLALALAIFVAAVIARRATRSSLVALGVTLVLCADHDLLLNAVTGLETGLAICAVTLLAWSALGSGRGFSALVLVALDCRPEAAVFAATALLDARFRRARVLAVIAGGLALLTLWRWVSFHDVLPNTYWAKAGGTLTHARLGLSYLGEAVITFPALFFAPLVLFARDLRPRATPLLVGAALWSLSMLRTGGDHFQYARLLAPLVPAATAFAAIGLCALARDVSATALLCASALWTFHAHAIPPQHGFDNVRRWQRVGEWLAARHPGASVATVPIGAISYFSGARVIDLVGLTVRDIAHSGSSVPEEQLSRQWLGHERHDTAWVLQQEPDLVVMTKWRATPWTLAEAKAGFWAELLLLREVKSGRAPYDVVDAELEPGVHWLVLQRR
ncbi:MAG: hypothetical protein ABI321_17520 [Polyangia bacterium]